MTRQTSSASVEVSAGALPESFARLETAAICERRRKAGLDEQSPRIGLALSGGGIRSATFSLGVVQALARGGALRRIDYLSTVSGGGYLGAFLGALFARFPHDTGGPEEVGDLLKDSRSWPMRWLRESGRYLSPNGSGDAWVAAAALLRGWVAIQVVLAAFAGIFLAAYQLVRVFAWQTWAGWGQLESLLASRRFLGLWSSVALVASAVPLALLLLTGVPYWLTQVPIFRRLVSSLDRAWFGKPETLERASVDRFRRWLTGVGSLLLRLTIGVLLFALVDSLGQSAYALRSGSSSAGWWSLGAGSVMVLAGALQKMAALLDFLPKRRALLLPTSLLFLLLAGLLALAVLVALSFVSHGFLWGWSDPSIASAPGRDAAIRVALCFLVPTALSFVFARSFGFVNLSSQQQLYAARLKRAYIGASNPRRRVDPRLASVTEPVPGDDLSLHDYRPHAHGGPLHLINVTINETSSGSSQVEQRDRKGLGMAVSPLGVSWGLVNHGTWGAAPRENGRALELQLPDGAGSELRAPEELQLGNWVAISGAAFSTGLGARTTLGTSLLAGLANVRLGYWWDSGGRDHARLGWVRRLFDLAFPVQHNLLGELLARFHGPQRRYWYLSDGGHFENTGCYELLRRRIPFVLALDCGQDAGYEFGDLANLVRKARTDLGARIELLDPAQLSGERLSELRRVAGTLQDFRQGTEQGVPDRARKHLLVARVSYADGGRAHILFVKPSLTGDEPLDVLEYHARQRAFPQESTLDQYFDEAQWESYRALGDHIGEIVVDTLGRELADPFV